MRTVADAEAWLLERELFGMRFGLDRMRRLLTVLGSPQRSFRAVHVVGTNGKSSTTRFTAALLGPGTGAYLSPHLVSFRERIRIGDEDLAPEAFVAAIERVAAAARKVDRTLAEGDRVTQFEALTAAAYGEFARREVGVAVVEAGLGGRWDATNVIDAEVVALTNVDLEHTRWLGPTVRDIAREKLAVVKRTHPPATLVVGAGLHPDALDEARAAPAGELVVAAGGADFQERNLAVALAAARALSGDASLAADAAPVAVPGRLELVADDPPTILDGAHNASGVRALVEALTQRTSSSGTGDERPLVAVVSILDDKDAPEMLSEMLRSIHTVVMTRCANPRALSPATLASLAERHEGVTVRIEPDPHRALALARRLARAGDTVLATGSIYLVADLIRPAGSAGARSRL